MVTDNNRHNSTSLPLHNSSNIYQEESLKKTNQNARLSKHCSSTAHSAVTTGYSTTDYASFQ